MISRALNSGLFHRTKDELVLRNRLENKDRPQRSLATTVSLDVAALPGNLIVGTKANVNDFRTGVNLALRPVERGLLGLTSLAVIGVPLVSGAALGGIAGAITSPLAMATGHKVTDWIVRGFGSGCFIGMCVGVVPWFAIELARCGFRAVLDHPADTARFFMHIFAHIMVRVLIIGALSACGVDSKGIQAAILFS